MQQAFADFITIPSYAATRRLRHRSSPGRIEIASRSIRGANHHSRKYYSAAAGHHTNFRRAVFRPFEAATEQRGPTGEFTAENTKSLSRRRAGLGIRSQPSCESALLACCG